MSDTIDALLIKPGKCPEEIKLETGLESLQKAVDGYIEVLYPFDEMVGVICNEEGKLDGLPLNRALRDEDGKITDVIAGNMLIVGLTEDDFGSLTPEQMKRYEEKFHQPECFLKMGKSIMAIPLPAEDEKGAKATTEMNKDMRKSTGMPVL